MKEGLPLHIPEIKPLHMNQLSESSEPHTAFFSKIKTLTVREVKKLTQGHQNRKEMDMGLTSRQYDSDLLKHGQLF